MTIHTDQATVDRWLADGRWVEFTAPCDGSGDCPAIFHIHGCYRSTAADEGKRRHPVTVPCETCDGAGTGFAHDWREAVPCPACTTRLPICAACRFPAGPGCEKCKFGGLYSGRITVAHAVVEWGPLVVEDGDRVSPPDYLNTSGYIIRSQRSELPGFREHWADGPIALPPDIDPQSLIGQWARGGTIEAAL